MNVILKACPTVRDMDQLAYSMIAQKLIEGKSSRDKMIFLLKKYKDPLDAEIIIKFGRDNSIIRKHCPVIQHSERIFGRNKVPFNE